MIIIIKSIRVVKTLTETTETLGLGKVVVEMDANKTVKIYVDHIEKKRKELGLNNLKNLGLKA